MTTASPSSDRTANGKSTFTKLITGRLPPMNGNITLADKLKVAYFAQHQLDELNPQGTALRSRPQADARCARGKVRARTGFIGFSGNAANTLVSSLSGGGKKRASCLVSRRFIPRT